MRLKSKGALWLVMLLAAMLVLAACGNGAEEGNGENGAATSNGTETAGDAGSAGDAGDAPPQELISGTITGVRDGEEFIRYGLLVDDYEGGYDNTATWQDGRKFDYINVNISTRSTGRHTNYDGMMGIDISFDGDLNQKPIVDEGNWPYKVSYSKTLTNGYVMKEGTVEVEEAKLIDEETLAVKGTFSGIFENHEGDSLEITDGRFDFHNVSRDSVFGD